ncbi:MAG: transketolase [Clostridiales bacterium]|jgi:transketolase|nr:transketolase [Clostridiales bacterium]
MPDIDTLTINSIRLLCADAVQKANSGHPGLPLGAAPAAYALWAKALKHCPDDPAWPDRDRFVLSAGHGSTLLYSLLHLFGYGLTIDDLKQFRQIGSKTPGHPEYGHTAGVETTTGPLGQGIGNAVGMAFAESVLAARFNKPGFPIVDHYTYALCGDGCMMEGVSQEAASFAGAQKLGKLIVLYDSNGITIEGSTAGIFEDDVPARFAAQGWDTRTVAAGGDPDAVLSAINAAKAVADKPSLIEIKTVIGYGSPNKAGKQSAHGEPLGAGELSATKSALGFDPDKSFYVPEEVRAHIAGIAAGLNKARADHDALIGRYKSEYPEDYAEYAKWMSDGYDFPEGFLEDYAFADDTKPVASRIGSERALNEAAEYFPNLIGGSGDLAPSTKTIIKDRPFIAAADRNGSNIHFGVREHAMGAIANGVAAHGGLRIYVAGFFVFSDYMKPSMRLAAMMGLPVVHIFTHDSIGVGEDGGTHQPIEQISAIRGIPGFTLIRPADLNETRLAWYLALTRKSGPTALILTRQNLAPLSGRSIGALRGGYVLADSAKDMPDVILIATGSEVATAVGAKAILTENGVDARVVSMPSFEIFEEQSAEYKESVLPKAVRARVAVEAGGALGWHKYAGLDGAVISIDEFGASGPYAELFKKYGFTPENVAEKATEVINGLNGGVSA